MFRRNTLVTFLLLVLVVALAVPASADRDDTMIVGRANGGKAYNTSLYSTNNTATLSLFNKNGSAGAPALALSSNVGPAMSIDSTSKIVNLNADYVDGYTSGRLRVRRNGCSSDGVGDPSSASWSCAATATTLPDAGIIDMTGSVDIYNYNASDVDLYCRFQYKIGDGSWTTLQQSDRDVTISANDNGICATDGWYYTATGITIQIRFQVQSIDSNVTLGQHSSWWIYVPD